MDPSWGASCRELCMQAQDHKEAQRAQNGGGHSASARCHGKPSQQGTTRTPKVGKSQALLLSREGPDTSLFGNQVPTAIT